MSIVFNVIEQGNKQSHLKRCLLDVVSGND